MDKRSKRVQPTRLSDNYFPLDIHKSMFINDLTITIPVYYVRSWGTDVINNHDKNNYKWIVEIDYSRPKDSNKEKLKFKATLWLSFIQGRKQESSYRIKWDNNFAIQLAKDYPKSFVRSLEFHIGDDYYKKLKFTEYDIGGFKEQVQVRINWENSLPKVSIKEFFKVRSESQDFPFVFGELSNYLIADYLLSDEKEILRRIQVTKWKPRKEISKEIYENIIYLLINREKRQLYIGETKKSLSNRYPSKSIHHSFDDWNEYSIIQLPPETSNHSRLLIERVLIATEAKLLRNFTSNEKPLMPNLTDYELMNKRK